VRRKRELEEQDSPEWMNSFADLMCLLLTFFVLLYSFSVIDIKKLESFLVSFQGRGVLHGEALKDTDSTRTKIKQDAPVKVWEDAEKVIDPELLKLYQDILNYLQDNNLQADVNLDFVPRGLVLTIKDRLLFDSGKAELRNNSKNILNELAGLFGQLDHDISVEGHTDNVPTNRTIYPTNWELSAARAISVVRFFTEEKHLPPEKFAAVGFGEWQPVAPNDTEKNRQLNRRVVIKVFTTGEGHDKEQNFNGHIP